MTKQTEALKLALEALNSFPTRHLTPFISSARTAIREALASEASEESSGVAQPDRHELQKDGKHPAPCARFCEAAAFNIEIRGLRKRLTEQPAQRKPLTDEHIENIFIDHGWPWWWPRADRYIPVARAIEAAHGIKENT